MMKMVKRRHKEDFQVTKPESWIQLETSKLQTKSARLQLGNCLDTRHLTRTALTVAAGTGGALRSSGTPPRHVQKENVCDIMWHFDQTLGANHSPDSPSHIYKTFHLCQDFITFRNCSPSWRSDPSEICTTAWPRTDPPFNQIHQKSARVADE